MRSPLVTITAEILDVPPERLTVAERPALPHQRNRLFDVRLGSTHLIAKLYCHPDPTLRTDCAEREHAALVRLRPIRHAPLPSGFRAGAEPVLVYEYVPGLMWDRQPPSPRQLQKLSDVWLRLAEVPTEGLRPTRGQGRPWSATELMLRERVQAYANWVLASDPSRAEAAGLCLHVVERMVSALRPLQDLAVILGFCHPDPRFSNVIDGPDGHITLIDWEDSGLHDPASNLACLLSHPNQEDLLTPAEWSAFMDPYLAARGRGDLALRERLRLWCGGFWVFWLGLILQEGVARARTGHLAGWRANEMPANLRLRRYLARALTWPETDFSASLTGLAGLTFFDS